MSSEKIHANLIDRLAEAKKQGWLGEVAAIETALAAADQKLQAMQGGSRSHDDRQPWCARHPPVRRPLDVKQHVTRQEAPA